MKVLLIILFPIFTFAQSYDPSPLGLPPYKEDISYLLDNATVPPRQRVYLKKLFSLFEQKRYDVFLKESALLSKKQDIPSFSNTLTWLQGHALIQQDNIIEGKSQLLALTNSDNLDIRHRALLDLFQVELENKNYGEASSYLGLINNSPVDSPHKEIAHTKLIHLTFLLNDMNKAQKQLLEFEKLYPNSPYLPTLYYFFTLNEFSQGTAHKTREYAQKVLAKDNHLPIVRLLAELEIQEKNYAKSLEYFLTLASTHNTYSDEAIFKAALLQKHLQDYESAYKNLTKLTKYYKKSPYFDRASEELADINILLQNYDAALTYFLKESGYRDTRQAVALLKIAEINFLKTNAIATRRAANHIQKRFPYSSYANEALYWVGRSYVLDEEYEKSIDVFDDYLLREPTNPKRDEILIFLGHSYAKLDKQAQARSYFQTIVSDSKNNSLRRAALLGLGQSYSIDEGRRSLEYFDRVWKTWPDSPEADRALYYSGAMRYNLQMNKDSLKNFRQLTNDFTASPFYEDSQLAIAKLEFKLENFKNISNIDDIVLTKDNKELVSEFKELQARSFFRLGDYQKALPLFQESFKLTSNKQRQTDLFLAEASTLRALGDHAQALKNYERYINALKNTDGINELEDVLLAEIVYSYLEIEDVGKAEETALYIEKTFPKSTQIVAIFFRLADEYFSKEKYKNAALYYNKTRALSANPSISGDALLREALSLDYSKDKDAEKTFEMFLKDYPNHFGTTDIMSRLSILQEKSNPSNSILLKNRIIDKYPDSPEAETSRLYFANQIGNNAPIEDFYSALSLTKDLRLKAKYLYKLGTKLESEGQIEESIQIFKDIHATRDPVHGADALFKAARSLALQKKYEESLGLYINIISQYDEKYYPPALDNIIQVYMAMDQLENAARFKKRLIEQFPNSKESKKWVNS